MRLPRSLLLMAEAVSSVSAAKMTIDSWYDCSSLTFAEQYPTVDPNDPTASTPSYPTAQCAIFKAPLCYSGVCEADNSTQIDVFVKRIKSASADAPNVFFMQGGPGAASPAMETAMLSSYSLLRSNVNVYTMDHRGTGRSTKLDCVAAQAQTSGSPGGSSIDSTEVRYCADELQSKYGTDLSSFSVTSAANDLKYFITTYLEGEQTFVYGVSYGTSVVERLIHLDTPEIVGYILDGISTTSGSDKKNFEYFSSWDVDYDEVGAYFLSQCASNEEDCGKYFKGTTVSEALRTLIQNLDSTSFKCTNPLDKILASVYGYEAGQVSPASMLRSVMGSLLASATRRKLIPILTYRISRCSTDDIKVLYHLFKMMTSALTTVSEEDQFTSDLLYKLIVYSEFWETPTPTQEVMYNRFLNTTISSGSYSEVETYCAFSKEKSSACRPFSDYSSYDASPILYKKDKYWNVAAKPPTGVSVLLMSSKMDPQTPHKYAEFLYEALNTKNKQLITFDQATHGTLWSTPMSETDGGATCGMQILGSYISAGGDLSQIDKSCVDLMPAASFKLKDSTVAQLLNATSAYDGEYTGANTPIGPPSKDSSQANTSDPSSSSGTSYKTAFIVFIVLFVVATVAAGVFVIKWRRAKKQNTENVQGYQESTA